MIKPKQDVSLLLVMYLVTWALLVFTVVIGLVEFSNLTESIEFKKLTDFWFTSAGYGYPFNMPEFVWFLQLVVFSFILNVIGILLIIGLITKT